MKKHKDFVNELLITADIRTDGQRPWDLKVNDDRTYSYSLSKGSLGFGESYMNGWWDCEDLAEMLTKLFLARIDKQIKPWQLLIPSLQAKILNRQSKARAFQIGEAHYDVGNDLYERMLGKNMVYTCGYWKNSENLDDAQEAKLDLVCQKIGLKKGMRVLDIGCGWASFAKFAAEKYGAEIVGITVSKEQAQLGKKRCEGLPVEIHLRDYRDVHEQFDRVVSLGMFEHVGVKNYRTYMDVVHRVLPDDGIFLLHTIGGNKSVTSTDPWIEKYIFPNSMLPSIKQIGESTENLFVMEDWHNFGTDYDKTLQQWYANFEESWEDIKQNYDERFRRMWRFYLLSSAASFRSRNIQLWQIVLSKNGVPGGYTSIR